MVTAIVAQSVQVKAAALAAPVGIARKDPATVTIAVAIAARHETATVDLLEPKTAVVAEEPAKKATAQPGNNLSHARSVTMLRKAR
jgi:hypothetical protein